MLSESELEAKYKIVYIDKIRYYRYDLSNLDYSLETTSPLSLETGKKCFVDTSWKQLLIDVCSSYLKDQPNKRCELLNYLTPWNNKKLLFETPDKNCVEVGDDIYLLCNQSAMHACIFLRDLLLIFGEDISKTTFVIFRTPYAEPRECREFYEAKTLKQFKYYWCTLLKKSEESFDKIVKNIRSLNKYLAKCSQAYDNFFLIQNNWTFSNYKSRLLDFLRFEAGLQSNMIQIADKYLTVLENFYKTIHCYILSD